MKKTWLLLLPLVVAACGTPTKPSPNEQMGTISLRLEKSGLYAAALPDPSHIRLAVTNSKTGFKLFKDLVLSEAQIVNIPVAAETGYLVEAVSYNKGYYYNHVLKYGSAQDIQVQAGQPTQVVLELQRPKFTALVPDSVSTGQKFNVLISEVVKHPWNDLRVDVSNQPTTSESVSLPTYHFNTNSASAIAEINAPAEIGSGKVYFQIYSLLSTERFGYIDRHLRFDISDPSFGDAHITTQLTTPGGGLQIVIKY